MINGKLGCNIESSNIIMGKRRNKSFNDLDMSSIETFILCIGKQRLIDFCNIDFSTGTFFWLNKKRACVFFILHNIDIKIYKHVKKTYR